jgi:hypothetical protein
MNNTLRECIYQTIHRNKKPLKLIAEEIGMSESYLTRSALPDLDESDTGSGCNFPLKKLTRLIQSTGDFCILDHIEAILGRVAVVLPRSNPGAKDVCKLAMKSVKEFGDLMASIEKSLSDDHLSEVEITMIKREAYEATQAIVNLLKHIEKGHE